VEEPIVHRRGATLPLCTWIALAITLGGCAGSVELGQVDGVVLLDGKPLGKAQIDFLPEADEISLAPRSTAFTDAQGRYSLTCDDERPGAMVGKHRVVLRDLAVYGDKFVGRGKEQSENAATSDRPAARFGPHYASATTTPLTYEVTPGKQVINVDLTSRP
jgi:hypothetical protein